MLIHDEVHSLDLFGLIVLIGNIPEVAFGTKIADLSKVTDC